MRPTSEKKNERKREEGKKSINWMLVLQVFFIMILLVLLSITYSNWFLKKENSYTPKLNVDPRKAALIDGIALTKPNPSFTESIRESLSKANITLDVYKGEEVTIDLLKNVSGYGLLILRLHSAIDNHGFLYLFSAERFNETEYNMRFSADERSTGAVREGRTFEDESYFALRADLLGYMNYGGLNGSIMILMGCNGTNSDHAINRLFDRGVRAIIAWDGYVDLDHTDNIIANLMKDVYEGGMNFPDAIKKIMSEEEPDLWGSKLHYLSPSGT